MNRRHHDSAHGSTSSPRTELKGSPRTELKGSPRTELKGSPRTEFGGSPRTGLSNVAKMPRSALRRQDAVANMREALARRAGRGTGLSSGIGIALGRSKRAWNLAGFRSWFDKLTTNGIEGLTTNGIFYPELVDRQHGISGQAWAHHERNSLAQCWLTGNIGSLHERKRLVQR